MPRIIIFDILNMVVSIIEIERLRVMLLLGVKMVFALYALNLLIRNTCISLVTVLLTSVMFITIYEEFLELCFE